LSGLHPMNYSMPNYSSLDQQVTFHVQPGITYQIAVDSEDDLDSGILTLGLTLLPSPPNDDFAHRIAIVGTSNVVTGSNLNASRESSDPNITPNAVGKTVWWSWKAPGD